MSFAVTDGTPLDAEDAIAALLMGDFAGAEDTQFTTGQWAAQIDLLRAGMLCAYRGPNHEIGFAITPAGERALFSGLGGEDG